MKYDDTAQQNWFQHKVIWLFGVFLFMSACSPTRFYQHGLRRQILENKTFKQSFTGFSLFDPAKEKFLCDINGAHHFIPASTNKLLTLYTCLQLLGDSLPSFQYTLDSQALVIFPMGDPCFLHPQFEAWQSGFQFIQAAPTRNKGWEINPSFPSQAVLGPGWAWDDRNEDYSAEITAFPVYGNVRRVYSLDSCHLTVDPPYWRAFLHPDSMLLSKEVLDFSARNQLFYHPQKQKFVEFEQWAPIENAASYVSDLVSDTLHRPFVPIKAAAGVHKEVWYGTPVDTVYRRMMHQSDNFIAEQLLLLCAGQKTGQLKQDTLIRWAKDSIFSFLPQKIRWVDGSGLSRYNLNTPQNNVAILHRLWQTQTQERLFSLFPEGGNTGTLKGWYKSKDGTPYIYAKSGSMSGVQCLSGYLITRRGKVLIFSFMHNNFVGSGKAWKTAMQEILDQIRYD
jgi:D-alanyl-D-alanine carboxypeptidase/D-alanyl-D-alanine-endopeptidase (penicillin-binding protein 4)